jgi:hypothetical protein
METELSESDLDEIVESFWQISQITEDIQRDISIALTTHKDCCKKLSLRLKLSEEEMQKLMDKAAHAVLDVMPLATMNRCNMFTMIMAMHSNITGDPMLHEVFRRINQRALEAN